MMYKITTKDFYNIFRTSAFSEIFDEIAKLKLFGEITLIEFNDRVKVQAKFQLIRIHKINNFADVNFNDVDRIIVDHYYKWLEELKQIIGNQQSEAVKFLYKSGSKQP